MIARVIAREQFRQSQQASEQGVQGSRTFEGGAEVCRSGSEDVYVRQMTEYKENFRETRGRQCKGYFQRHRRVLILRISSA